jgi:hypothetical protein
MQGSGVVGRNHDLYGELCEECEQVRQKERDREQVIALPLATLLTRAARGT